MRWIYTIRMFGFALMAFAMSASAFVDSAADNRIGFYNAEGKAITFGFDAQGRITAITNAIGKVIRYQYDVNGNLVQRTDARGQTTAYQYSSMNRLTNVVHQGAWKASFAYDSNGNNVSQASPLASSTFNYDPMNRLASSLISVNSRSFAVTNSYDVNGNRTNIVYPGGLSVGYTYDAENRLTGTILTGSTISTPLTFSFGYDGASRLVNMSYPNGVNSTFGYDAESRITNYVHGAFLRHVLTRDPRGYKTREDIYAGLVPNFTNSLHQTRTHNAADQLLSAGTNTYSYDANGNLTNAAGVAYQWDYDNRLINVSGTQYLYDGSGGRIGRIANGVTNYFILDYRAPLKMPLAEADSQGRITRYYVWGTQGLLAHLDMNPTNGVLLATRYYHSDEMSSTLALTDESGAVTDQFAYSPHGQLLGRTGSTATPYLWLGGLAVRSEGSGLYFMLNRYYSADMRRFIQPDPSGIDSFPNLYAYGNMNSLFYTDPYGLCAESFGSYVGRSWDQVWKGNYGDNVTALGTAGQIGTGLLGIDLPGDIRDLTYDIQHWENSWSHVGQTALDAVGLIPVIGALKYADEGATLLKPTAKTPITNPSRLLPPPSGPNPWAGDIVSEITTKPLGVERFAGNPRSPWVQIEGAGGTPSTLSVSPGNAANRISSSVIPAGTRIQSGTSAAIPEWSGVGGARQIEILDNNVWQNQMLWEVRPR